MAITIWEVCQNKLWMSIYHIVYNIYMYNKLELGYRYGVSDNSNIL